jgi:hypothetical protein
MTPKRQAGFGKIAHSEQTIKPLPNLTISNGNLPSALMKQGEVFKYRTPKELFKFLVANQSKQCNGKTILDTMPDSRIHVRHLKLLLNEYSAETIGKAILKASFYCKHPYSVRLIKYFCGKRTENEQRICGSQHENT